MLAVYILLYIQARGEQWQVKMVVAPTVAVTEW